MRQNIEQQTWLITGISSGIGYELAKQLLQKGYRVIGFVREKEKIHSLKEVYPETLFLYEMDVRNFGEVDRVVTTACEEAGTIHTVVSNAGISLKGLAEEVSLEELMNVINTNLIGAIVFIRACIPFLKRDGGKLIQISSVNGEVPSAGWSYYCASKHGINGFCESLAGELRPYGVSVILVEPGRVNTELWNKVAERCQEYDVLRVHSIKSDINVKKLAERIVMLSLLENPPEYAAMGSRASGDILRRLAYKQEVYRVGQPLAKSVDERSIKQPILKIPKRAGERSILMWPLGRECKRMIRSYNWSELDKQFAGFVDLDKNKAGKYCVGRRIYQFEEISAHCADYYFVIATKNFREPIEEMLMGMNLVYGKDFCYHSDLMEEKNEKSLGSESRSK